MKSREYLIIVKESLQEIVEYCNCHGCIIEYIEKKEWKDTGLGDEGEIIEINFKEYKAVLYCV